MQKLLVTSSFLFFFINASPRHSQTIQDIKKLFGGNWMKTLGGVSQIPKRFSQKHVKDPKKAR